MMESLPWSFATSTNHSDDLSAVGLLELSECGEDIFDGVGRVGVSMTAMYPLVGEEMV